MKVTALLATFATIAVASASGCSSSSGGGGGFASQFCSKVSSCGQTVPLCQGAFNALVLSTSCQNMLDALTCADLSAPSPPAWFQSCFPSCSTTSATCNGDGTITECNGSTQYVYECTGVCTTLSLTYTGSCGMSYGGNTSTTDKCWCK